MQAYLVQDVTAGQFPGFGSGYVLEEPVGVPSSQFSPSAANGAGLTTLAQRKRETGLPLRCRVFGGGGPLSTVPLAGRSYTCKV
jgi:hypothetical protein